MSFSAMPARYAMSKPSGVEDNAYVEYDISDMDWQVDEDYLTDRVSDVAMDLDGEDNVNLGW